MNEAAQTPAARRNRRIPCILSFDIVAPFIGLNPKHPLY
jgi:hypothetical protein